MGMGVWLCSWTCSLIAPKANLQVQSLIIKCDYKIKVEEIIL